MLASVIIVAGVLVVLVVGLSLTFGMLARQNPLSKIILRFHVTLARPSMKLHWERSFYEPRGADEGNVRVEDSHDG